MSICQWPGKKFDENTTREYPDLLPCDQPSTTVLTKNSGQIVQLCEKHFQWMVGFLRIKQNFGDGRASHLLVTNKVRS